MLSVCTAGKHGNKLYSVQNSLMLGIYSLDKTNYQYLHVCMSIYNDTEVSAIFPHENVHLCS